MVKSNALKGDSVLAELISIKRLMVFSLLNSGVSQQQIAAALGVDPSQVSRMFPKALGKAMRSAKKSK